MRAGGCFNLALHSSSKKTSIPKCERSARRSRSVLLPHNLSVMKSLSTNSAPSPCAYPARSPPAPAPPLVLIVEDHEDTRFMLRVIIEMRGGINVVEAENGETATALAESLLPDLILMDGTLPLLDGFAATRRIRELASGSDVPIVFLSGHAHPASAAQAFAAGCTDYLVKPFAVGALELMLERHLARRTSG